MIYKKIDILPCNGAELETFIMFETVSARAGGVELLCFDIIPSEDGRETARRIRSAKRLLRIMKERGTIQCFAFPESFSASSAEAAFILNKYSEVMDKPSDFPEGGSFVYVKT